MENLAELMLGDFLGKDIGQLMDGFKNGYW